MKTNPSESIYPHTKKGILVADSALSINKDLAKTTNFNGLTKREYFAASQDISKEVEQMVSKNPDPARLSRLTGVEHPEFGTKETPAVESEWDTFWFDVEATLKVMKADALIKALNKTIEEK